MLQVMKTYDTSTMEGRLELLADSLAMPADNLALSIGGLLKQHVEFTREIAQTLAQTPVENADHQRQCEQLHTVSRAVEMILQAQDLLNAAKFAGEQLCPKQGEMAADLPGPAIARQ